MAQNPFHFLDQRYGILYPVTLNYHNLKVFLKDNLKICCLLDVGAGFVKWVNTRNLTAQEWMRLFLWSMCEQVCVSAILFTVIQKIPLPKIPAPIQ